MEATTVPSIATVAAESVDRLSKILIDQYRETDEEIGPRVRQFEFAEGQLRLIGQQLTSLRDAASVTHEAHQQLIELATATTGEAATPCIPSVRAYGEKQDSLARQAQTLAAHYDRFVNLSVNQLEGLALVVSNKYKSYCNKVTEMRRCARARRLAASE